MSGTEARAQRARIEARNAAQWLARLARSYAAPTDEIRLAFDPAARRILTPELMPGLRVALALSSLVLQFEENGRPSPHPLDVDGKSSAEVEAWLLAELLHRDVDRARFSKRLPYGWPQPMSGDEVKYASRALADELDRLALELETAAGCLVEARSAVAGGAADRALACWPRDFAFGFEEGASRISFTPGDDGGARSCYRVTRGPGAALVEIEGSAPRAEVVARLVEAARDMLRSSAAP